MNLTDVKAADKSCSHSSKNVAPSVFVSSKMICCQIDPEVIRSPRGMGLIKIWGLGHRLSASLAQSGFRDVYG